MSPPLPAPKIKLKYQRYRRLVIVVLNKFLVPQSVSLTVLHIVEQPVNAMEQQVQSNKGGLFSLHKFTCLRQVGEWKQQNY